MKLTIITIILNLSAISNMLPQAHNDDWLEALEEAHNLAQATLMVHNQQSGIEHMGGPFRFEDYAYTVEKSEDKKHKMLCVEYTYRRPNDIKGFPDSFKIYVSWGLTDRFKYEPNNVEMESFEVMGKIDPNEIKDILKILPVCQDNFDFNNYISFISDPNYPDNPRCVVTVNDNGKITRDYKKRTYNRGYIHSMKRLSSDRIQVFYSCGYRAAGFDSTFISERSDLIVEREKKGTWQPVKLPLLRFDLSEQHILSLPLTFLLIGNPDDESLREIIDIARRVPRMHSIAVIENIEGQKDHYGILYGQGNSDTLTFGIPKLNQPIASVTLKNTQTGWSIIRVANNTSFNDYILSDEYEVFYCNFPLLPKPTSSEIVEVVKRTIIDISNIYEGTIEIQDVEKICEILMRFHGMEFKMMYNFFIVVEKTGYVRVVSASGKEIYLKKINGTWVIQYPYQN